MFSDKCMYIKLKKRFCVTMTFSEHDLTRTIISVPVTSHEILIVKIVSLSIANRNYSSASLARVTTYTYALKYSSYTLPYTNTFTIFCPYAPQLSSRVCFPFARMASLSLTHCTRSSASVYTLWWSSAMSVV
jgi:hypothetical protein